MGIERDYLMRQLMMLFEVIQKIFRLRRQGDQEQVMEQVRFFYDALEIEENIEELTIEELVDLLVFKKKLTNEHLEMVAYVMKEQGEITGDETLKLNYFRKSWFLLDKVERESSTFSMDRLMKLEELKGVIGE